MSIMQFIKKFGFDNILVLAPTWKVLLSQSKISNSQLSIDYLKSDLGYLPTIDLINKPIFFIVNILMSDFWKSLVLVKILFDERQIVLHLNKIKLYASQLLFVELFWHIHYKPHLPHWRSSWRSRDVSIFMWLFVIAY